VNDLNVCIARGRSLFSPGSHVIAARTVRCASFPVFTEKEREFNMKRTVYGAALAAGLSCASIASAEFVNVVGGQTNVLLDTALLSAAAGLDLSGASAAVIAPGDLGADSVAFGINPVDGSLPTTFAYDTDDFLGTFSGTIEHTGSIFFNEDMIEVGDFTIGFDAARAGTLGGLASGFFVESTTGLSAILFDIENPSKLNASASELVIAANLLVSPEFGTFLFDNGFSTSNLMGADVGDALVAGTVPAPGALALLGLGAAAGRRRRRG
jgi:MYXO-CTERM domain-containing protein